VLYIVHFTAFCLGGRFFPVTVYVYVCMYTVSKNKQNYFCYNHVRLPPNLIICGTKVANSLKLYQVYSFYTSPNSCQCTTC